MNTTQTETLAELIERLRSLSIDHGPKGWPAVRTRDVTALLDRIAELEAQLEAIGAGGVNGPLMTPLPVPQPALSAGWVSVKDRLPPCRDDQDYIGINSAGFAGIFNAVADIAGNVYCMMETAEESVSIMSDLSIWKPFIRPLPASPTIEGESK